MRDSSWEVLLERKSNSASNADRMGAALDQFVGRKWVNLPAASDVLVQPGTQDFTAGLMSYSSPTVPVFSYNRCFRNLRVARAAGDGSSGMPPPSRTGISETSIPSTSPAAKRLL